MRPATCVERRLPLGRDEDDREVVAERCVELSQDLEPARRPGKLDLDDRERGTILVEPLEDELGVLRRAHLVPEPHGDVRRRGARRVVVVDHQDRAAVTHAHSSFPHGSCAGNRWKSSLRPRATRRKTITAIAASRSAGRGASFHLNCGGLRRRPRGVSRDSEEGDPLPPDWWEELE